MNCPRCGSNQVMVIDSRNKDNCVKRRRRCLDCFETFGTIEIYKDEYKNFKRNAYNDAIRGIEEALESLKKEGEAK